MVLNALGDFFLLLFFAGMNFHTKNKSTIRLVFTTVITIPSKFTMSSHVVTVKDGMEMKNKTKTKMGVGYVVKAKVGELERIKR